MERDRLATMRDEGLSLEAIGERVGKHPSTVGYWVKKHGLEAAHAERHRNRGGIDRVTLTMLIDRGLTVRGIASELGCSYGTVQHWLRHHGLCTTTKRARYSGDPGDGRRNGFCPRHGDGEFVQRSDGAWRCVRCRSEAVSARRRRVKRILVDEAGGACVLCGYQRSLAALPFHHIEPSGKRFAIAAFGAARSLERTRAEARKCVLLCANCHAEVEAGEAALPAKLPETAADYRW